MKDDLIRRVARNATCISPQERMEMNREAFERMGFDIDDLTRMANVVDIELEDILSWDVRGGGTRLPIPSDRRSAVVNTWVDLQAKLQRLSECVEASLVSVDNAVPQTSASSPEVPSWCHGPSELRPPEYPFGPLTGTQKELARWITGKEDRRRLQSPGRAGGIWIRRINYRTYEAWFRHERRFNAADSSRNSIEGPPSR